MKRHSQISVVFLILLIGSIAHGQTLRVLTLYESGANPSSASSQTQFILSALTNSGISKSAALVNAGIPAQMAGSVIGSSLTSQLLSALNGTDMTSRRNANNADIVFVFVDALPDNSAGNPVCGVAFQQYWQGGTGMIPPLGPDVRGREDNFYALISTTSICRAQSTLVAHEFGHLMGAHHELASGDGVGLLSNSYGDFAEPPVESPGEFTIMIASFPPSQCTGYSCTALAEYSNSSTHSNPPLTTQYRNSQAIDTTHYSVSIYREPSCGLATPTFVNGTILDICYGGTETRHRVSWTDSCQSASEKYFMYKQQPTGGSNPYTYFGTVFEPNTSTDVLVNGADSNIKVKTCAGAACSPLSLSKYIAQWVECH